MSALVAELQPSWSGHASGPEVQLGSVLAQRKASNVKNNETWVQAWNMKLGKWKTHDRHKFKHEQMQCGKWFQEEVSNMDVLQKYEWGIDCAARGFKLPDPQSCRGLTLCASLPDSRLSGLRNIIFPRNLKGEQANQMGSKCFIRVCPSRFAEMQVLVSTERFR